MNHEHSHFLIGTMILVLNEKDEVLLGKRRNAFAAGEYGIPSGHMEHGETFIEAAIRELNEETGLKVTAAQLLLFAITNYIVPDWADQYVTFDFMIHINQAAVITQEPDKCEAWEWYALTALPQPLHYPAERSLQLYQQYLKTKIVVIS